MDNNRNKGGARSHSGNRKGGYQGKKQNQGGNSNGGSYSGGGNRGRNSFSGGNRYGQNRSRSGRGRGGRRNSSPKIDINKFIGKAEKPKETAAHKPDWTYDELLVHQGLTANIAQKGYKLPTPIQEKAIPELLKGKDVLGIANTGTGKTAAFLIPLIEKVINGENERVIIITPTRELAEQISDELYILAWGLKMSMTLCIGGASIGRQLSQLRRKPIFIVGTPGRLIDLIDRKALDLTKFNSVVLDEVDRMLDMGFINDIKKIIGYMPVERQSLFFSATMDKKIKDIIKIILKDDYVDISVKTGTTAKFVEQNVIRYKHADDKLEKLKVLLKSEDAKKVLVFINMKYHVDRMERWLKHAGFRTATLHGNKRQNQRTRAVEAFKSGKANILLATDVAARGLDINDITHVINYDIPNSYDEYVHRIGRTGRANRAGTALTFVPVKY